MKGKCIAPTGANATRYGETPFFAEGLYDLGSGCFAWMVPNGSWGESNAGLITGKSESLLVDTLWDVPKTQTMLNAMQPILDTAPLSTTVNTHADGDHFWGNQLVADTVTLTSERARDEMAHHRPDSMMAFATLGKVFRMLPSRTARKAGHYFRTMCEPYDFAGVRHTPAVEGFSGTTKLDIGGRAIQLIEVGPAHTQGDLIVHVPDAGILYAGDILFIGSTPVMWAGPVENWLKALDLILDLDATTIVPGHGPITGRDGVHQVKEYWEFTRDAARARFDAGATPFDAAFRITESETFADRGYHNWDSPERMMTNMHVLYREFAGNMAPLSVGAKINIMRQQAMLAHALSEASPAAMRLSR